LPARQSHGTQTRAWEPERVWLLLREPLMCDDHSQSGLETHQTGAVCPEEAADHVAAKTRLIQERENLRAQVRDLAADIRDLDLIELAAYRAVCRKIESERRNGGEHSANENGQNVHGVQKFSEAAAAPDSGRGSSLPIESVQDSTPPIEPKSSVFNEAADVSLKEKTVPSSSSGGNATDSATTTTQARPEVSSGTLHRLVAHVGGDQKRRNAGDSGFADKARAQAVRAALARVDASRGDGSLDDVSDGVGAQRVYGAAGVIQAGGRSPPIRLAAASPLGRSDRCRKSSHVSAGRARLLPPF
jgi:hypothetical protein